MTTASNPALVGITAGPDRALWFTEWDGLSVGRITTAGAVTEYPLPLAAASPYQITAAADGALWFTDANGIGRMTTSGAVTQYDIATTNGVTTGHGPGPITVGPDGELWSADNDSILEAFFVTANLSVSPDTGFYRTDHTFTGSGFAPNETVNIYLRGVGSGVLATATADTTGSFTVPARQPEGDSARESTWALARPATSWERPTSRSRRIWS